MTIGMRKKANPILWITLGNFLFFSADIIPDFEPNPSFQIFTLDLQFWKIARRYFNVRFILIKYRNLFNKIS